MVEHAAFEFAGERFVALADRALFWPTRRRLVLGDLHLGKGDIFRHAGIAVPSGGSTQDLARLSRLVARWEATSLWVLGDFLHGAAPDGAWRVAWQAFRAQHRSLDIAVIAGNHDRALERSALDVAIARTHLDDGAIEFAHRPRAGSTSPRIVAHEHPVVRVPGFGGRHPCFAVGEREVVLPAFSAFTGGHPLARNEGWIACIGDCVLPNLR